LRSAPGGSHGFLIRAEDAWTCVTLEAWIRQRCLDHHIPKNSKFYVPLSCCIIGAILRAAKGATVDLNVAPTNDQHQLVEEPTPNYNETTTDTAAPE
jgi:hypothetical protein